MTPIVRVAMAMFLLCFQFAGHSQTVGNDACAVFFSRAAELMAARQFTAARAELAKVLAQTNATPAHRSIAQLEIARSFVQEQRTDIALGELAKVSAIAGAPRHHLEEAAIETERICGRAAVTRMKSPETPAPAITFHVAPNGRDSNAGSREEPFATLEAARDAIRKLKAQGALPSGGVAVVVHAGTFPLARTFQLASNDSGTTTAPIVYRAAAGESPEFSGGIRLRQFEIVKDASVLSRLAAEARGKVMQVNLHAAGVTNILPLELGGFASGRGFKTHPSMELFFNGEPLRLARWPNVGFIQVTGVTTNNPTVSHGLRGTKAGVFNYDSDRPLRWKAENDILLYGYWFWDWADSYERVASIDTDKREIKLAPPFHGYGYRKGQKFYALNLLCEIDQPGEWYLDRESGILYLWPPSDPNKAIVEISATPFPFVELRNVSHVRFEGLTFDLGSADAIHVSGGEEVLLAGCTVKRFAGAGISINGGHHNGVLSCDVFSLGRDGISISGGDRKTLTPAGHFVENCHIHDLSRIDHTYTPAVRMSGVGNRIAHNLMHHIRSSAINLGGNDHVVEFNEAGHVVQESDDQGGVDMFGNPTYRGNAFRWNYFHHIGPWQKARTEPPLGQAGIRLDDAISGTLIYGNIFRRAATGKIGFGGVQIHGGKDNVVDRNLFVDCATAVSFSPWAQSHWLEFTKNYVGSKEIDFALYTSRYPELSRLNEDLNVNDLWRNEFVNCDRVLHRNKAARLIANNELKDEAGVDAELTRFPARKSDATDSAIGTRLEEIGLYRDGWRRELPSTLIGQLRQDR